MQQSDICAVDVKPELWSTVIISGNSTTFTVTLPWHKRVRIQRKLWRNDLKEGEDPAAHIEQFKERITELSAVGRPTSNEEAVFLLLTTFPSSYDQLVMTIDATGNVPSLDNHNKQDKRIYLPYRTVYHHSLSSNGISSSSHSVHDSDIISTVFIIASLLWAYT